mmetsp:Transcript_25489/g.59707  ORF Transcript_25489/g.59707 Transcript_25489/m.59707 type:complete len:82 (+) Transcript_25489:654-899(+)
MRFQRRSRNGSEKDLPRFGRSPSERSSKKEREEKKLDDAATDNANSTAPENSFPAVNPFALLVFWGRCKTIIRVRSRNFDL